MHRANLSGRRAAARLFCCLSLVLTTVAEAAAPAPAATEGNAPFTFEKLSERLTLAPDRSAQRETTTRVRIRSDVALRAFNVLVIPFTRGTETVELLHVRVHKPDGAVVETPIGNAQELPAAMAREAPMYSDARELHVAVRGLAVGDVLEWSTRARAVALDAPDQFWWTFRFSEVAKFEDAELIVDAPVELPLSVISYEVAPTVTVRDGRRRHRWKFDDPPPVAGERTPTVRMLQMRTLMELTTFPSWARVGEWYAPLQEAALAPTPAIRAKAEALVRGVEGDEARIRALYTFVATQVRYVQLAFGIGRYRPHDAQEVLDNLYGDCKDKHTLLTALLRAVGYDAWPALVGSVYPVEPRAPSPGQFDHVVTVVPLGERRIWLDTTPEIAPFGLLAPPLRGSKALLVVPGKPAELVTVPEQPPFYPRQRFEITGTLGADGVLNARARVEQRGDAEMLLRFVFRSLAEGDWPKAVQELVQRMGFGGVVSEVEVSPPLETTLPMRIEYAYRRASYGDWPARKIGAPLPVFGLELADDTPAPTAPVPLGAPSEIEYRSSVTLPPGYTLTPPRDVDVVEPFAEYHARYRLAGDVFVATRVLQIRRAEVAVAEWPRLLALGKVLNDEWRQFVRLRAPSNGTPAEHDAEP